MSQYRLRSKELPVSELQKQLQHVNLNAAGIDVGSDRHLVAVPEGRDDVAVREFGAFTADLHALANWLSKCGVTTVAMESTGVYWIPVFELLEGLGFEVKLVDARRVIYRVANQTCWTASGCNNCIPMACWREPFVPHMKFVCYVVSCVNERCWCKPHRCTSNTCRRRCSK